MNPSHRYTALARALIGLAGLLPLLAGLGEDLTGKVGVRYRLLATMGVVQLGLGLMLFMLAVRYLSSAEVTLLSVLEILFGVGSTWLLIGERPTHAAMAGGSIVIAALMANQIAGMRQAQPAAT